MAIYYYKTINKKGAVSSGKIDALTHEEAVKLIKREGSFIIELDDRQKRITLPFDKRNTLSPFEKINFTDHMSALIRAGTPIKEALEAYTDESGEGSELLTDIMGDIEGGNKLSDAFAKHPNTFSKLYIALIKAGEITGSLDETLEYAANELRREYEFIQKVKSAFFYPGLVLGVSAVVITFVFVSIVPRIIEISQNLGQNMPAITKMMIDTSKFLSRNSGYIFLLITVVVGIIIYLLKEASNRNKIGAYFLKFPVVGVVIKKYVLARLLRIVSSCIKYGIPLTVAFDTAKGIVGNIKYQEACDRLVQKIQKGTSLSVALSSEGTELFPNIIARSIRGAEKTGGIETALNRLSIQYEIEVDRGLKKLTELLEPILTIFLGGIVLVIAVAVIVPIYQLTTSIR